jgi:asparagine synthase (glutamine-hydrolysing)
VIDMCGIAGIVKLDPWETVEEARLKQMRDVLRHRGPDGEGLWIDGPVGLAHRRLAIVDVAGGQQPMTDESGETWITYNGEIYNHPRLRPELEARGYRYRTRSDTETVLHMYRAEGEGFAERLQGMFALALWDRRRRRLGLVRDRLGIKPLYWTLTAEALLFASEIKALLAALPGRPAFNDAVLPEFLASGFVAGGDTFFTGVHALPPGHMLWWSPGEPLRPRRYWRLPAAAKGATPAEHAQQVRARLEAAVASHLMSDVPLGVFLSGGIDSSALCGLMARITREPVRAFSVAFADTDANELPWARLAARAAGAVHREVVVSPAAFFAALPRLIWHEDEPLAFPSSVPLYFVSRLARDYVKVVLTGEGADELFGGYNRYRVAVWNERLAGRWHRLAPGPLRAAVKAAARRLPGRAGRYAARTFLARADGVRDLYFDNFAVFPEAAQRRLLAEPGRLAARDPYAAGLACHAMAGGDPLDRLTRADIETYLVELLMKQDQMSMAASVESRVPFLDHDLVEHVVAMPGHLKLRGWRTKAVLREAVADVVPRAILDRRKMGFPVPVGRWLRQAHSGLIDDVVLGRRALARGLFDPAALRRLAGEHASGVADHGAGLWLLLNLELWQRIFLDGEDTAGLEAAA